MAGQPRELLWPSLLIRFRAAPWARPPRARRTVSNTVAPVVQTPADVACTSSVVTFTATATDGFMVRVRPGDDGHRWESPGEQQGDSRTHLGDRALELAQLTDELFEILRG